MAFFVCDCYGHRNGHDLEINNGVLIMDQIEVLTKSLISLKFWTIYCDLAHRLNMHAHTHTCIHTHIHTHTHTHTNAIL